MQYDESHPIRFTTLPEFYGDTMHNDKTMDSMADLQPSPIEKSMHKRHMMKAQLLYMGH